MIPELPSTVWIAALAVVLALFLLQTARLAWARASRVASARRRVRRAIAGEHHAEPLLRRAGYEVLDRQVPARWTVFADGEPLEVALRADLLVAREGRTYVAEVKTGRLAPRLDHAPTRRQLLEYRVAFGVDGVLLVDAEADRIMAVEMDLAPLSDAPAVPPRAAWLPAFLAGIALGTVVVWIALR
ncbi:MAG TPA: PD-(D/E)XK nuclease family protein [Polyangiaceae bacterium]